MTSPATKGTLIQANATVASQKAQKPPAPSSSFLVSISRVLWISTLLVLLQRGVTVKIAADPTLGEGSPCSNIRGMGSGQVGE